MTDALFKMLGVCFGWIIAYLITLYITSKMGMGYNVLKNSLKWLSKLKSLSSSLRSKLCAKDFSLKSRSAISSLKNVVRCERGISRILTVYMFDNKDDKDVVEAATLVSEVSELSRKAAAIASDLAHLEKESELDAVFSKIDENIAQASSLIKKSIERDIKEELLKV